MNILIIGASRGIGLRLLEQAIAAGHQASAFARGPVQVAGARALQGSVFDAAVLSRALAGQQAVCCSLGLKTPWEQRALFSEGTRVLLEAMARAGVRRLVCVTGVGAGDSRGHGGFLYDRIFMPFVTRGIYADKDRQEALIRASSTDWTIVRPGFLTNGPLTGSYRVLTDLTGITAGRISRADVAHFMLKELETSRFLRQTPLLTY